MFKKVELQKVPQLEAKFEFKELDFKSPVVIKEFANVTHCEYFKKQLAIASSTRIQLYAKQELSKSISSKELVTSVTFREDGKLLASGDINGIIRVYDLETRSVLRTLVGHKNAVRDLKFSYEKNRLISCSDDNTVKYWDVTQEECLLTFEDHSDYCRSVAVSKASPNFFCTGSYDHSIKLWDSTNNICVLSLDHGHPVEKVLILKSGTLIVSSGGNKIKFWDIMNGGKLVHSLSNHQKTITTLALDDSGAFLMSGSLDHQLKMISLEDYKVVKTIKYPAPILSIAVSINNGELAVGMTGGLLCIRSREIIKVGDEREKKLRRGTFAYLMRGGNTQPNQVINLIGRYCY